MGGVLAKVMGDQPIGGADEAAGWHIASFKCYVTCGPDRTHAQSRNPTGRRLTDDRPRRYTDSAAT